MVFAPISELENGIKSLFAINSFLLIFVILAQNDNFKNTFRSSNSTTQPLEIFTWILVVAQFAFLLIKIKL